MIERRLAFPSELPEWYETNTFIKGGFRRPSSCWNTFLSIFEWHNETLNIHSHLWPGVYWLVCLIRTLQQPDPNTLVVVGYVCSTLVTLISAIAHTFHSMGPKSFYLFWRIDQMGIVAINYAHMQLDIYLLFAVIYNRPDLFIAVTSFQTLIAIYSIVAIAIIPWAGKFWAMAYPIVCSIPLTLLVNVYAYLLNTGLNQEELYALRACAIASATTSVLVIFSGAVFYVGKFPERYYSRVAYDYCGSHFWFHSLIVLAITASFQAEPYIKILDARRSLL